jgi:ribonuclease VapC
MMVIDSSAFVAIYKAEPEREAFEQALVGARELVMGASVYLETVMVLSRHGDARGWFNTYIVGYDIRIAAVDETVARLAADAFERYGRGQAHPARLNFGDCLSYAVAKALDAPLLFKGDDFRLTDVAIAA